MNGGFLFCFLSRTASKSAVPFLALPGRMMGFSGGGCQRGSARCSVLPTQRPGPKLEPEPSCPKPSQDLPCPVLFHPNRCISQTNPSAPHPGLAPNDGRWSYLLDKILGLPRGAEAFSFPFFHPLLLFQAPLLLRGSIYVPERQISGHLPPEVPGDAWRRGKCQAGTAGLRITILGKKGASGQAICRGSAFPVPQRPLEPGLEPRATRL